MKTSAAEHARGFLRRPARPIHHGASRQHHHRSIGPRTIGMVARTLARFGTALAV